MAIQPKHNTPKYTPILESLVDAILSPLANATNMDAGWDNDDDLTLPETVSMQSLMDNLHKSHIDQVFSKLLNKGNGAVTNTVEPVIDPEKDMYWFPKEGGRLLASQMETRHLFFALRYLFNKAVPQGYRIDVETTQAKSVSVRDGECLHAIKILFYQIGLRDNISEDHLVKLTYMARVCREHL